MYDLILSQLAHDFSIIYSGEVQLQDDQDQTHTFYILEAFNATILVDTSGQFWMNETSLVEGLEVNKKAIQSALLRFINSQKGQQISSTRKLRVLDNAGRNVVMNFYNEATVAAVIVRMQETMSDAALKFIGEREKIISTVRRMVHERLMLADANAAKYQDLMEQNMRYNLKLTDEIYRIQKEEKFLSASVNAYILDKKRSAQVEQRLRDILGDETVEAEFPLVFGYIDDDENRDDDFPER